MNKTLTEFLIGEQRKAPGATGGFTALLNDVRLACKRISYLVGKGALGAAAGEAGTVNAQGERQMKLDVIADGIFRRTCEWGGTLAGMVSEEMEAPYHIPAEYPRGRYLLAFDPLDGSSNIDVNVPVGTIFSVVRKVTPGKRGQLADMLQPGSAQVAAGYVIYGSSTMLVYTTGQGVHGFTLDPAIGEFLLSHPNIRIPDPGRFLSVNESYERVWQDPVKALIRRYRGLDGEREPMNVRYVGSLVADFHRNLLAGGVFAYPSNRKSPRGKLRLLYEANPLAFIVEQAGGGACDGEQRIMDVIPTELHQRTPLYIGSKSDVATAREMLTGVNTAVGA